MHSKPQAGYDLTVVIKPSLNCSDVQWFHISMLIFYMFNGFIFPCLFFNS